MRHRLVIVKPVFVYSPTLSGTKVVLFCVKADFNGDEVCLSFCGDNGVRSVLLNASIQYPLVQVRELQVFYIASKLLASHIVRRSSWGHHAIIGRSIALLAAECRTGYKLRLRISSLRKGLLSSVMSAPFMFATSYSALDLNIMLCNADISAGNSM